MISTCIAEKSEGLRGGLAPVLFSLAVLVPAAPRMAGAHPVSQGVLEVVVLPDRVTVLATVSNEEVLVEAASRGAGSSPDAPGGHGDYLLRHLHIAADEGPLAGRVA